MGDEIQNEMLFKESTLPSDFSRARSISSLARCFTGERAYWKYPHDVDIVVESLVCGAEFIATNNLKSIRHSDLNTWGREKLGANRDIIGDTTSFARRYLNNDHEMLLVIAAMSVEAHPRDLNLEMDSVRSFMDGLKDGQSWSRTSLTCASLLNGLLAEERTDLINRARDLAIEPAFTKARHAEDALQTIRARCLLNESERGTIAPLTQHEQGLIDKYAI